MGTAERGPGDDTELPSQQLAGGSVVEDARR